MAKKITAEMIREIVESSLQHSERIVKSWFPVGKMRGNEYLTLNSKRGDKDIGSFCINLQSGKWSDFAGGNDAKGGDLVSLHHWYFATESMSYSAKVVGEMVGIEGKSPTKRKTKADVDWCNTTRNPPRLPSENEKKLYIGKTDGGDWITRSPVAMWQFKNDDGSVAGYCCRFETTDDQGKIKKDIMYLTWCSKPGQSDSWRFKHFSDPRPLMNLDVLKENQKMMVLVTEGEKCCQWVSDHLFGAVVGVTWPGGSKAIDKVDWSPIIGRMKILFPDNDKTGFEAMLRIAEKEPDKSKIKFFLPSMDKPEGWDIADAGSTMDAMSVKSMIKEGLVSYEEFLEIDIEKRFNPVSEYVEDNFPVPLPPEEENFDNFGDFQGEEVIESAESKWRCLGFNKGDYYYYSFVTGQLVKLTPRQHDESYLLQFASIGWWLEHFPTNAGNKPNWTAAKNYMMEGCHRVGIFDDQKLRGCGAWLDEDRIVIHKGDYLLIDGKEVSVEKYQGKYIYEADIRVKADNAVPLSKLESYKLLEACRKLTWERDIQANYVAGWIVCSIIGGVLPWRPHLFITGSAGSGKSYVMNAIVKRLLGREVTQIQGETTSAGYRALAANRSWPVWGDEIEAETPTAQARLEELLQLWRCSSTDTDAGVVKSTQDGKVRRFIPRSCVCISAIGMNLSKNADTTRFTVVSLKKPIGDLRMARDKFDVIDKKIHALLTEEYCSGFRSRVQKMAKIIRENARTFSRASGEVFGARMGDQIGTLLSGAYSLTSDGLISLDDARNWVREQDWSDGKEVVLDEVQCLNFMLSQQIQIETTQSGRFTRSIGELIYLARPEAVATEPMADETLISPRDALNSLKRFGIDRDKDWIYVSTSHPEIKGWLKNTPWPTNWRSTLARLDGAQLKKSHRFHQLVNGAIMIMADKIFTYSSNEDEDSEAENV
jgi:putative DNA primase/helicase